MANGLAWRYQSAAFAGERPVVVPESHLGAPSIAGMAHDMAARLPPAFDLAAWSMGGYIALALLPLVRAQVRRVVLIHTSARPESAEATARRQQLLRRLAVEPAAAVLREQLDANLFDPARVSEAFKQAVVAESVRLGMHTLRSQIGAMAGRADARTGLRDILAPVLVIAGRHDAVAPVACAEEMASLLPDARLHVFEDAAHCAPWEKPDELNALMRRFLA